MKIILVIETQESCQAGLKDHLNRIAEATENKFTVTHIKKCDYDRIEADISDISRIIEKSLYLYGKRLLRVDFRNE
jgi:hypothetical protein